MSGRFRFRGREVVVFTVAAVLLLASVSGVAHIADVRRPHPDDAAVTSEQLQLDLDGDGIPDVGGMRPLTNRTDGGPSWTVPAVNETVKPVEVEPVDTDGDGIPDEQDDCPTKPEKFNGFNDQDGCPDTVAKTRSS